MIYSRNRQEFSRKSKKNLFRLTKKASFSILERYFDIDIHYLEKNSIKKHPANIHPIPFHTLSATR